METLCHCSKFLLPPEESTAAAASSSSLSPTTTTTTYALVILNQRLPRFAPLLWEHGTALLFHSFFNFLPSFLFIHVDFVATYLPAAKLRVCADGGANRVFDEMPLFFPHEQPSHVRSRFLLLPSFPSPTLLGSLAFSGPGQFDKKSFGCRFPII